MPATCKLPVANISKDKQDNLIQIETGTSSGSGFCLLKFKTAPLQFNLDTIEGKTIMVKSAPPIQEKIKYVIGPGIKQ